MVIPRKKKIKLPIFMGVGSLGSGRLWEILASGWVTGFLNVGVEECWNVLTEGLVGALMFTAGIFKRTIRALLPSRHSHFVEFHQLGEVLLSTAKHILQVWM